MKLNTPSFSLHPSPHSRPSSPQGGLARPGSAGVGQPCEGTKLFVSPQNVRSPYQLSSKSADTVRQPMALLSNQNNQSAVDFRYFTCVWGKKSTRKHKKWEGDAVLRVGTTSVLLIDEEGIEIGRSSGMKVALLQNLEEGGNLGVGGKEIEITGVSDCAQWEELVNKGKIKKKTESSSSKNNDDRNPPAKIAKLNESKPCPTVVNTPKHKPFRIPARVNSSLQQFTAEQTVSPGRPMFDSRREGAVVLPHPPPGHLLRADELRLVEVVVDPFVGRHLRPHQKLGLIFMYENVLGFHRVDGEPVYGAILADEMGLGKTLQTVALVWTLLKQSPVAGSQLAKKVLIVTPSSLLRNWEKEFRKWLGTERIILHVADSKEKVAQFRNYTGAPILLVSYEMMVRNFMDLTSIKWDLIVCDEAHRLKNSQIKASTCLADFPCRRRIFLTGTPVQNDLGEFYNLVEGACPGLLGSKNQFATEVEAAVETGRQPGASLEEMEKGRLAMESPELKTKR